MENDFHLSCCRYRCGGSISHSLLNDRHFYLTAALWLTLHEQTTAFMQIESLNLPRYMETIIAEWK